MSFCRAIPRRFVAPLMKGLALIGRIRPCKRDPARKDDYKLEKVPRDLFSSQGRCFVRTEKWIERDFAFDGCKRAIYIEL